MISIAREINPKFKILRKLLITERNYRKALPLIMELHQMVHSSKMTGTTEPTYCDEVLKGINDQSYRIIPKNDTHSIIWRLWHITRIEDVTTNLLLSNRKQVFNKGAWSKRLNTRLSDVGNEMSGSQVAKLSQQIDIKALLAYRIAVGRNTERLLRDLSDGILWEKPTGDQRKRLYTENAIPTKDHWLGKYWCENDRAGLLLMPITRHCLVHINEIARLKSRLASQ